MNLTAREKDKLLISMAAIVARRRLDRVLGRAQQEKAQPSALGVFFLFGAALVFAGRFF